MDTYQANLIGLTTMNNSQLFKQAHAMTKQVIKTGDNYQVTFGLCLKAIKADAKQTGFTATIVIIAFAIIATMIKPVQAIKLPNKKGYIVYANKDGQKVAFEVTTVSNEGFVAKDLYNRKITIFKMVNNELVSSDGYVYDTQASKEWAAMYDKVQKRLVA